MGTFVVLSPRAQFAWKAWLTHHHYFTLARCDWREVIREIIRAINSHFKGQPSPTALLVVYLLWSSVSYRDDPVRMFEKLILVQTYMNDYDINIDPYPLDWYDIRETYDYACKNDKKRKRE